MKILLGAVVASFAMAASAQEIVQHGYARVLSVEPIVTSAYRTVPRTSCTTAEPVADRATGTNQSCTTYHDKEYFNRIHGYNVAIEYDGEVRTVRMTRDPGVRVPVKVVKRVYVIE
jgi:uncharacterized protein YcfJ